MQHTVLLQKSELKSGFVEKHASRKYLVPSDPDHELIVHINTLVPYCAKLQLYDADVTNGSVLSHSRTNDLLISPDSSVNEYIVEVFGEESCSYEISYAASDSKIYELVTGHAFTLEMKAGEQVYFLYYNNRNESFRVVGMLDHGYISYRANALTNTNISDLAMILEDNKAMKHWEFAGATHDVSLIVDKANDYFCVDCYYLIEVSSEQAAFVTLLLHSNGSAIPLRENRYVRETLEYPESIRYAFLKMVPFKLNFIVIAGNP